MLFRSDHFKDVNDRHGHLCGDAVLSTIGKRMKDVLRGSDLKCRYGGEEFLVLLPETPLHGARRPWIRLGSGGVGEGTAHVVYSEFSMTYSSVRSQPKASPIPAPSPRSSRRTVSGASRAARAIPVATPTLL